MGWGLDMASSNRLAGDQVNVAEMLGLTGKRREVAVDTGHGVIIVEVDERGALVCPVCGKARFYNPRDLAGHLAMHARQQGRRHG